VPSIEISIPAGYVQGLVRTLLGLYAAKAETIRLAVLEQLDAGSEEAVGLPTHQAEMAAVGDLLDQFNWSLADRDEPAEIGGPDQLVAEVLRVLLHESAADLAEACETLDTAAPDLEPIDAGLATVADARDLFAAACRR